MKKYYSVQVWPILTEKPESPVTPESKVVSETALPAFLAENIDESHYVVVSLCDVVL